MFDLRVVGGLAMCKSTKINHSFDLYSGESSEKEKKKKITSTKNRVSRSIIKDNAGVDTDQIFF